MKKFNALDVIVVIILVVCAVGAAMRFMGSASSFRTASNSFDYVVKVEALRIYSADALKQSAEDNSAVKDTSKETAVGNVYKVDVVPAKEAMELADGSVKWCDVKDRYDAYVYVKAEGEITPQSYVCKSGTEILMNRENYYTTKWSGFYGTVIDVGEDLSQQNYSEN